MKYIKLFLFVGVMAAFTGCEKAEKVNNTETRVGSSRVTFFPLLALNGEKFIAIPIGASFTDPGITATIGGADAPYETTTSLNTAVAGVYPVVYTSTNVDGIAASISRLVIVYDTDASAAGNDLSGTYVRSLNGQISVWTKIAPGVYTVLNPGGAAGTNLTVAAINPTGFTVRIPPQPVADGSSFSTTLESYTNSNPATYSWKIVNGGYGTAVRTFVKQ